MSFSHLVAFVLGLGAAATAAPFVAARAPSTAAVQQQPSAEEMKKMQEQMKRWMDACTPGENHKQLARFLGTWDLEQKIGMSGDPSGKAMVEKGTSEWRWLVEGKWLMEERHATMMGKPIHGFAILGYDNFKQAYVGCFVDSLQTTLLTFQGKFDRAGNDLVAYGTMDEPMTGENDKMVKYVWRTKGPDKVVFEVHDLAIGETNAKVVETTFTRAKKAAGDSK